MLFAPLEGWRHVEVTDRHSALVFAHLLKDLSDTYFPFARKIKLVQDNLNTLKFGGRIARRRKPRPRKSAANGTRTRVG
jgi:hypothetical protein